MGGITLPGKNGMIKNLPKKKRGRIVDPLVEGTERKNKGRGGGSLCEERLTSRRWGLSGTPRLVNEERG